jgi:hypothetical protein
LTALNYFWRSAFLSFSNYPMLCIVLIFINPSPSVFILVFCMGSVLRLVICLCLVPKTSNQRAHSVVDVSSMNIFPFIAISLCIRPDILFGISLSIAGRDGRMTVLTLLLFGKIIEMGATTSSLVWASFFPAIHLQLLNWKIYFAGSVVLVTLLTPLLSFYFRSQGFDNRILGLSGACIFVSLLAGYPIGIAVMTKQIKLSTCLLQLTFVSSTSLAAVYLPAEYLSATFAFSILSVIVWGYLSAAETVFGQGSNRVSSSLRSG